MKCAVASIVKLAIFPFMQDTFFYSLVYDPAQKTLLADKGEIRVGSKYQADIPDLLEGESFCSSLLLVPSI